MRIVTNNPLVRNEYPQITEYLDTSVKDILTEVRYYVHIGAELLNHPISGNLAPGENPYISLVLKDLSEFAAVAVNYFSLSLIEEALEQLKEPPEDFAGYDLKTLDDFKVMDLDMLKVCIEKLN